VITADAIERINNMIFGGIHKLTLLDYPEQTACTVYTIGCNFLCPFCQNVSLIVEVEEQQDKTEGQVHCLERTQDSEPVPLSWITETEVLEFLETRRGLLDGVCIGGGEPLLQKNLESFIDKIKALGFLVKLDTNGSFPDKLENLIKNGKVDYVAMDIKNAPKKYAKTIGLPEYDISPIEQSIQILRDNAISYEFRTTVVREFHSLEDLLSIARWISWADKYYLQSFINSDGVLHKGLTAYSDTDMHMLLVETRKILSCTEVRG
jgi:pyruvate formate lyase activating enzyme